MKRNQWFSINFLIILLLPIGLSVGADAAAGYSNDSQLSERLLALQREHPDFMRLSSLAVTREKRTVHLLEIGVAAEKDRKRLPAMMVVAGLEGTQLAGTEIAATFIAEISRKYSDSESIRNVLKTSTIYVVPCLNPDAVERYFLTPKTEKDTNSTSSDEDHDGFIDEDGPEDLNGDGIISAMRVEHPEGKYIEKTDDPRVLIEANPVKGERGKWMLLSEGKDNDGDEKINEDGLGGVNFNRNFPYNYPWFDSQSGLNPISEPETRALADFLIANPQIGLVYTLASNDNLLKTPEAGERSEGREPQTKIRTEDIKYYEELGKNYRDLLGIKKSIDIPGGKGAFADWIYFHRGRFSLCTRVWSPDIALALPKKEEKSESPKDQTNPAAKDQIQDATPPEKSEKASDQEAKQDERGKTETEYLQWLDKNAPNVFLSWKEYKHPDFPGRKVEIGGLSPLANTLPPYSYIQELGSKHSEFILQLAQKLPRIHIREMTAKHLGSGVFELKLILENTGYLPTVSAQGERAGVQADAIIPTRIEIDLPRECFLTGEPRSTIGPLKGGETTELRYTLLPKTKTQVLCNVISALAGTDACTVDFKTEGGKE